MRRFLHVAALVLVLALAFTTTTLAQSKPEFRLGFKALADLIPEVVGEPLEDEHYGPNGDSLQQTTKGLMVWRKADNWTAFTNGSRTWINGPFGVQERGNLERFDWENINVPSVQAQPTPEPTVVAEPTQTAAPVVVATPSPTPVSHYAPDVKAMDEKSAGPGYTVKQMMLEIDEEWAHTWGWRPRRPVTIYLYSDGRLMAEGISQIGGIPLSPQEKASIAVAAKGVRFADAKTGGWAVTINLEKYEDSYFWRHKTLHALVHEYTHVMQSDRAGRVGPTWFKEGMAELLAFVKVPQSLNGDLNTEQAAVAKAYRQLPPLRMLQDGWEFIVSTPEGSQLAYGASYYAVKYISMKVGGMPLLKALERTAQGEPFEVALMAETGYSLERLDLEYPQIIPVWP